MSAEPSRRALRQRLLRERLALPAARRIAAAEALPGVLAPLPALSRKGHVAGYWAMRGELSLHALLGGAPRPFVYCLPRVRPESTLLFAPWRVGDPLDANRFGIPEPDLAPASCLAPDSLDLVLVPLLGFDRRGNRLGSGAGFYDRSFAFLQCADRPSRPLLVGVGYAMQEIESLEAADWDVPLDFVATEHELIDCAAARG